MSKERARRRAEREREAAIRSAARAAKQERRERRAARARVARRVTIDRMPRLAPAGRPAGPAAQRRRGHVSLVLGLPGGANVLWWVVRPDWPSRFAALVVSILAAPVLVTLLV